MSKKIEYTGSHWETVYCPGCGKMVEILILDYKDNYGDWQKQFEGCICKCGHEFKNPEIKKRRK
jgi:hypothetical protein